MTKKLVHLVLRCIIGGRLLSMNFVSPTLAADSHWIPIGPEGGFPLSFAIAPGSPNILYAGSDKYGGIYKSTDSGQNWAFMGMLWELGEVLDIAIHPIYPDIVYAACSWGGVFKTTDGGDNWFSVNNGLIDRMVREIRVDPLSSNILYAITNGLGGVYKSTDRAGSWTQITTGMQYTLVQAMCFDASHTLYAAIGWGTYRDIPCIFKSRDSGNSWNTLATIPSPFYLTSIWDIEAHPDSADLIYVGGMSHYKDTVNDSTLGLLYRSHDGGDTWEELWTPEPIWILCLAIDPISKNIYAGTGGSDLSQNYGVYRSTDGGDTWEETSGWESPGNSIFDMAIDPVSSNILYAGTGGALFMSTDYGGSWAPRAVIPFAYTILIDPASHNTIYAGTMGSGIFKYTDETHVEDDFKNPIANGSFWLYNYPNPFNPTTTITYQIPVTSHVTLKIFDISGRLITELIDDQEQTGHHQIIWDGTDHNGAKVGSGVYFIHLKAAQHMEIRKIMLIK